MGKSGDNPQQNYKKVLFAIYKYQKICTKTYIFMLLEYKKGDFHRRFHAFCVVFCCKTGIIPCRPPPKKNDIGIPYHGKPMTSNPEGSRQENVLPSRQKILHSFVYRQECAAPAYAPFTTDRNLS